ELSFRCDCSLEKMYSALITLSSKDIQDMIDQDHGCEIVCQYCNKKYYFNEDKLKEIIVEKAVNNR
ncbi:MAG: Hsp33 family molecular chaperone HslO, partial [Erysipelotrichaceae bacterium]|nr:Hsp33 family molecular chaperone HslO [Erysipelotrichaceae bacterium]